MTDSASQAIAVLKDVRDRDTETAVRTAKKVIFAAASIRIAELLNQLLRSRSMEWRVAGWDPAMLNDWERGAGSRPDRPLRERLKVVYRNFII